MPALLPTFKPWCVHGSRTCVTPWCQLGTGAHPRGSTARVAPGGVGTAPQGALCRISRASHLQTFSQDPYRQQFLGCLLPLHTEGFFLQRTDRAQIHIFPIYDKLITTLTSHIQTYSLRELQLFLIL